MMRSGWEAAMPHALGARRPFGLGFWPLPEDAPRVAIRREDVRLVTEDGALVRGVLWTPPAGVAWKTALVLTHPRGDFSVHYACPLLAAAGYAAFGFGTRYLNNDTDCLHEALVVDVKTAVDEMRRRGAEAVVLLGNSGGGSLMALAQKETGAGNGFVAIAAHPGEGVFMMQAIDPSVADEGDPFSVVPELDMYDPRNGWRPWPAPCRYDRDWLARYRAAQRARVARLDRIARAQVKARNGARGELASGDLPARPWHEQARILRNAVVCPYMVIYRTEADLRAFDLSLDVSERDAGSLFSYRPDLTNYMEFGFGRVQTPRAWLSTWSGLSSNADVVANAANITVPSLVIYYRGDNAIFPSDARAAYDAIAASDKTLASAPGDHYGFGVGTQERTGAPEALAQIVAWLKQHFPT